MTSRPTVEPAGVSEGKLMELYEASPNVLLRVTDNELRGLGPLVRDVIDDLLAARQQLAEMRGALHLVAVSLSLDEARLHAHAAITPSLVTK